MVLTIIDAYIRLVVAITLWFGFGLLVVLCISIIADAISKRGRQ